MMHRNVINVIVKIQNSVSGACYQIFYFTFVFSL